MYQVEVYKEREDVANIEQLSVRRDWMDGPWGRHAYNCFPITLMNRFGWGLSFPDDITFIWDGNIDPSMWHVKILEGEKWCHTGRGNGTISFKTGLTFRTSPDVTLLQLPVPNQFNTNYQAFTTSISTSFYPEEMPVSFKILQPNVEITIKAGEPIISIVPISLSMVQDSTAILKDGPTDFYEGKDERFEIMKRDSKIRKWSHFYKNATDHHGNKVGEHELTSIDLHIIDKSGINAEDV